MTLISMGSGMISVAEQGSGENAILFVHGNSSCKEAFARLWACPELQGFRCVAFDLPGHGDSSDAQDAEATYTIPGYAEAAQHVIVSLGLTKPLVVGWSLGGHTAIELALSGTDLAGVLITGAPPVGPGPSLLAGGFTPFTFEQSTGDENASEEALLEYAGHMYGLPSEVTEQFVSALLRTAGRARSRMTEHWLAHEGPDHLEFAKSGALPFAIAHADKDPFVDPVFLDGLASPRLWGGKIHHFPQSGHAPFLDQPMEFARLLKRFADDTVV
ncbi:MAG: alpha/beta hydrolase [Pseudomonadota bacterium]